MCVCTVYVCVFVRLGVCTSVCLNVCVPLLDSILVPFITQISEQLLAMSPEEILCRWVNYQLNKVGCKRVVKNFTQDIKDSEVYANLLVAVCPEDVNVQFGLEPLNVSLLLICCKF